MPITSPKTLGVSPKRHGVAPAPMAASPSWGQHAAQQAVSAAQQQFGAAPGMGRFFAQPGMSAANPLPPQTTMHSGPGTPGLRRAYMSLLSGQPNNDPNISQRDMRALYGGNASIGDASNLRFIAPLVGLQHIYSGQGSGQW